MEDLHRHASTSSSSPPSSPLPNEELQGLEHAPPFWRNPNQKKILKKQLSMCEVPRDRAWERRRRQFLRQDRRRRSELLTDEDMDELKGCIELGFGFTEQSGQRLCSTIPALDLYFAVNRQFSSSPVSSPGGRSNSSSPSASHCRSSSVGSPTSDSDWKIIAPGEDPRLIKTKLRHWAQAVACSLKQSS